MPGIYNLTVTNSANGCSSFASAEVKQNIVRPEGVTASASGILTCKTPGVMLSGSSVTKDVSFNWTGPDFTSKQQKAEIKSPGKYVLTVTNPVNGCNSTATVTVIQNTKEPEGAKAIALDTLTCKTSKVKLSASSTSGGTVYKWTGPGNFTSQTQNTIAVTPGNYTVEITDPVTGCSAKRSVIVLKNIKEPETDIAPSGVLTCSVKSVTLKTKPAVKNTTYKWSGPDDFSSASPEPSVVKAGIYNVTVTSILTGCSSSKSVEVKVNMTSPQGVAAKATGSLSCATPKVKLSGTSSTEGITYRWSGPQDFVSTLKTPEVNLPGTYTLYATNPENGCVSKTDVTVQGEKCAEK